MLQEYIKNKLNLSLCGYGFQTILITHSEKTS